MAVNLGTAYIRIAPQLSGVQSSITKELNGVGASSGESFSKGFSTKAVAVGTLLGNLATKAFSSIGSALSSSLGAAVSRSDELSYRFAASMQNVGIAGDDAAKAISRASDALIGLPTTTDDAARSIKKLAATTGDVDKATDYFLAFNNAVVAGAAPAERQSEAILQMGEAYARGKPDMKEWRIWMETMPGQLDQVAQKMGYGAGEAQKLGEDLRKGGVSMDEFMQAFSELNTTGLDGLPNLADQAQKAVGGLEVSMTRMKTAFTRGLAGIIDTLQGDTNEIGKIFTGFGGIVEGILSDNQDKVNEGSYALVTSIETILPRLTSAIGTIISRLGTFIRTNLPSILNALVRGVSEILRALVAALPDLVKAIVEILPELMRTITEALFAPETIQTLLDAALEIMIILAEALPNMINALIDSIDVIIESVVGTLLKPENLQKMFVAAVKIIGALARGLTSAVGEIVKVAAGIIGKIGEVFNGAWNKVKEWGANIAKGLVEGIQNATEWVKSKIQQFCTNALDAIKSFFGISSPSKLMAEQGKFLAMGFGEGIEDNAKYATKAMDEMANEVMAHSAYLNSALSSPLSSTIGLDNGNAIARNITQYNTFNQVADDLDVKEASRKLGFAVETAI